MIERLPTFELGLAASKHNAIFPTEIGAPPVLSPKEAGYLTITIPEPPSPPLFVKL